MDLRIIFDGSSQSYTFCKIDILFSEQAWAASGWKWSRCQCWGDRSSSPDACKRSCLCPRHADKNEVRPFEANGEVSTNYFRARPQMTSLLHIILWTEACMLLSQNPWHPPWRRDVMDGLWSIVHGHSQFLCNKINF